MKEEYPYQSIFERDNFTCQYCGLDASREFEAWWHANLNIDHVRAKSHGGTDDLDNMVVACRACNLYKGSVKRDSIEEARSIIKEKRAHARDWFRKYVLKEAHKIFLCVSAPWRGEKHALSRTIQRAF